VRKRMPTPLAVFTVFMAVAVAAQAQETESDSVEGRGSIWAKGSGVAVLDGKGRVHMAIDGDVVSYDLAGDAVVKIGAVPEDEPDGAGGQLQEVAPGGASTLPVPTFVSKRRVR
jgi:hypothetical protein